jgi:hypothetical protein
LRECAASQESDARVRESDARVGAKPDSDAYHAYVEASENDYRAYVEASKTPIREQEELHARVARECSARAANGEDVRARWDAGKPTSATATAPATTPSSTPAAVKPRKRLHQQHNRRASLI